MNSLHRLHWTVNPQYGAITAFAGSTAIPPFVARYFVLRQDVKSGLLYGHLFSSDLKIRYPLCSGTGKILFSICSKAKRKEGGIGCGRPV